MLTLDLALYLLAYKKFSLWSHGNKILCNFTLKFFTILTCESIDTLLTYFQSEIAKIGVSDGFKGILSHNFCVDCTVSTVKKQHLLKIISNS